MAPKARRRETRLVQWVEFFRRLNAPSLRVPTLPDRLVDCERCGCDFVTPVAWHEQGESHWWIRLRCGQCDLVREVEVTDVEAARFDQQLDRGLADIAAALARNKRDGGEALMAALRCR
jgi:hypothetical protein